MATAGVDFPDANAELNGGGIDRSIVDAIAFTLFNKPGADIKVPEGYAEPVAQAIKDYKDSNPGKQKEATTSGDILSIARSAYDKLQKAVSGAGDVEKQVAEQTRSILGQEAANYRIKGTADAVTITEEGNLALAKAAASKKSAQAYGLDMSDPANIVQAAGAEVQKSFFDLQKKYQRQQDLKEIQPYPNPFKYVIAQSMARINEPALKNATERFTALNKVTAEAQQRVVTQDNIEAASIGTTTTAAINARADAAQATAGVLANKAEVEAQKTYIHAAEAGVKAANAEVQRATGLAAIDTSIKNHEDAIQAHKDAQATRTAQNELIQEERQMRIDAKKRRADEQATFYFAAADAAAAFGIALPTDTTPENLSKRVPKDLFEPIKEAIASGNAKYGQTPLAALDNVGKIDQSKMPTELKIARSALYNNAKAVVDRINNEALAKGEKAPTKPEADKAVQEFYNTAIRNVDKTDNPYTARTRALVQTPPAAVQTYYKELKDFQETKLAKSMGLELNNNPTVKELSIQRTFQIATEMVAGKVLSQAEAAKEVATYFKAAVAFNNSTYAYEKFNLPVQQEYSAVLQLENSFFKRVTSNPFGLGVGLVEEIGRKKEPVTRTLDLTKPSDTQQVLVKIMSNQMAYKMSQDAQLPKKPPEGAQGAQSGN